MSWQVNWETPTWMSRYLVFDAVVDGHLRTFAVATELLSITPEEPASATLQRSLSGMLGKLEDAVAAAPATGMVYVD